MINERISDVDINQLVSGMWLFVTRNMVIVFILNVCVLFRAFQKRGNTCWVILCKFFNRLKSCGNMFSLEDEKI
jgi:hypothetical protein